MLLPRLNDILLTMAHVLPSLYNNTAVFFLVFYAFAVFYNDRFGGRFNPDLNPLFYADAECAAWLPVRALTHFDDFPTAFMNAINLAVLTNWPDLIGPMRVARATGSGDDVQYDQVSVVVLLLYRVLASMIIMPVFVGFTMDTFNRNFAQVVRTVDRQAEAARPDLPPDSRTGWVQAESKFWSEPRDQPLYARAVAMYSEVVLEVPNKDAEAVRKYIDAPR
jgi:hypothetical protein